MHLTIQWSALWMKLWGDKFIYEDSQCMYSFIYIKRTTYMVQVQCHLLFFVSELITSEQNFTYIFIYEYKTLLYKCFRSRLSFFCLEGSLLIYKTFFMSKTQSDILSIIILVIWYLKKLLITYTSTLKNFS